MLGEAFNYALKRSISLAGAWASLPGALVVWLVLRAAGYQIAAPENWIQGIAAFIVSAIAAWVLIVVGRFCYWPYHELGIERDRRQALEAYLVPQLEPLAPNIAPTTAQAGPSRVRARYVRVPIKNTSSSTAHRCAARLIKIEHQNSDGTWRSLAYNDTLDMAWANKPPGIREVDLNPNSVDLLDVIYAIERNRELHLATIVRPHYPNLMGLAGQYRFIFQLTSEDAGSQLVALRVHWGLDIDAFDFPSDPIQVM